MRRALIAAAVLGVCATLAWADGVLRRSDIARERMRRLQLAYWIYWNDSGRAPSDPAVLFPGRVADPRTFWHPGDSDPPPRTINNSVPNARNSARISFDWPLNMQTGGDTVFMQDNSAANNGGRFINMLDWGGLIETDPPLATPTPTRTTLAQAHLRRIAMAMQVYAGNNQEWFPQDLKQLWDDGTFHSPRTFWHPGDSDPMPTDITNSVPNASNSTQISFEYLAAGVSGRDYTPPDMIIVRDNTPANNGGRFILMATLDGLIETDPPAATRVPTKVALAKAHLRRLGQALAGYALFGDGRLPDDLLELWTPSSFSSPRSFWNPGDRDPLPTDITSSVPNGSNSAQVSFEYLVAGRRLSDLPTDAVLIRDNTPWNNEGLGRIVVRGGGGSIWRYDTLRVEYVPDCPGDVDGDHRVAWRDLYIVLRHLGMEEGARLTEGDVDGDGDVDADDLRLVLTHMGAVCPAEKSPAPLAPASAPPPIRTGPTQR